MSKILLWLQERIKRWTKLATLPLIPGLFSDLTRSRADLVVENAVSPLKRSWSPRGQTPRARTSLNHHK